MATIIRPIIKTGEGAFAIPGPIRLTKDGKIGIEALNQLNSLISAVAKTLNEGISLGTGDQGTLAGNLRAQYIEVITPTIADTEFVVPHGLGRRAIGYDISKIDKGGIVYVSSAGSWSSTLAYFKCTTGDSLVLMRIY